MLAGMLLSQEHTRPLAKELFCPTLNQASWFSMERTYTKEFTVFLSKAVIQYAEAKVKYLELHFWKVP